MTVRPVPNQNINPTSLSKSYDDPERSWKRLVIALWHPCFRDECVIDSIRELRERGY